MAAGLVYRGKDCFICLNAFPYTSGHVMVIPHVHEASLAALPATTAAICRPVGGPQMQRMIRETYAAPAKMLERLREAVTP